MKQNLGSLDRLVRGLVIAPVAVIVALLVGLTTPVGLAALGAASIMGATAARRSCPLYTLFGISTCGRRTACR